MKRINPAFTMAEHVTIEDCAAALGISASEYSRRCTLGHPMPRLSQEQQALREAAAAQAAVGNLLNQLVRHTHAGRIPHADRLAEVLTQNQALQDRICTMLDRFDDPGRRGVRPQL